MLLEIEKKKRKEKKIKIASSLGYRNSYFYNKKGVICCSINGYIYHFLDYIK